MAKSPPHLKEVEFRLWWHLYTVSERNQIQLVLADFYNEIKDRFPVRNVDKGEYIYRQEDGLNENKTEYYLNRAEFKVITRNEEYRWDQFSEEITFGLKKLLPLLQTNLELDHVHIMLNYQDLFDFDFKKGGIIEYLNTELDLEVNPKFIDDTKKPLTADISLKYDDDIGKLTFQALTGTLNGVDGVVTMTQLDSRKEPVDLNHINKWTVDAHNTCSEIYSNIISKNN